MPETDAKHCWNELKAQWTEPTCSQWAHQGISGRGVLEHAAVSPAPMTITPSAIAVCQTDFGALSRILVIMAMVLACVVALPLQSPRGQFLRLLADSPPHPN
jgi:hypothetical protein